MPLRPHPFTFKLPGKGRGPGSPATHSLPVNPGPLRGSWLRAGGQLLHHGGCCKGCVWSPQGLGRDSEPSWGPQLPGHWDQGPQAEARVPVTPATPPLCRHRRGTGSSQRGPGSHPPSPPLPCSVPGSCSSRPPSHTISATSPAHTRARECKVLLCGAQRSNSEACWEQELLRARWGVSLPATCHVRPGPSSRASHTTAPTRRLQLQLNVRGCPPVPVEPAKGRDCVPGLPQGRRTVLWDRLPSGDSRLTRVAAGRHP